MSKTATAITSRLFTKSSMKTVIVSSWAHSATKSYTKQKAGDSSPAFSYLRPILSDRLSQPRGPSPFRQKRVLDFVGFVNRMAGLRGVE